MAEVFGVVASAIAMGQAAESVVKLKQLWTKVQDAPKRFSDLFVKLEVLAALLEDVDRQFADPELPPGFWDRNLAQQSLKLCRNVSCQLETLCNSLNDHISSPKRSRRFKGAIKVVMNDDGVRELETRLESALSLLQMAHQCYLSSLTQALPDVISQRMTMLTCQPQSIEKKESHVVPDRNSNVRKALASRKKSTSNWELDLKHRCSFSLWGWMTIERLEYGSSHTSSLRIRDWLTQRMWKVQNTTGWGGWQFSMQVHNTIPDNGLVMRCIRRDDAARLLQLFDDRKASPYDRSTDDRTLLYAACAAGSHKVTKLLLELGIDVEEIYPISEHPDPGLIPFPTALNSQVTSEMVHLWADYGLESSCFDPRYISPYQILANTHASDDALKALQRRLCPDYFKIDFIERCQIARAAVSVLPCIRYPSTLAYLVNGGDRLSLIDLLESDADGFSLLISATMAFGSISCHRNLPAVFTRYLTVPEDLLAAWREFLVDILSLGYRAEVFNPWVIIASLVHWEMDRENIVTPLLSVMQGASCMIAWAACASVNADDAVDVLRASMHEWLEVLHSSGADLIRYGLWEQHQRSSRSLVDTADNSWWSMGSLEFTIHLVGFEISSHPDEWTFWLVNEYELYALEFWEMLGKKVQVMPGSWVD